MNININISTADMANSNKMSKFLRLLRNYCTLTNTEFSFHNKPYHSSHIHQSATNHISYLHYMET